MKSVIRSIFALSLLLLLTPAYATPTAPSLRPSGISGSVGLGYAQFQISQPTSSSLRLDQAVFASLSGERGFGVMNLYLTLSLNYMTSLGQVNYDYTTVNNARYSAPDARFSCTLFQAGLGLKFKLIDGYWFRPYIEGGGTGGFFTINYNDLQSKLVSPPGTDYKSQDSLLDFGTYGEGGIEVSFSDTFGVRAAARFINDQTKEFETLAKQKISYQSSIYYFAGLVHF